MSSTNNRPECGRSLEELSAYLDTGEISDPGHVAACPDCQAALDSLGRLATLEAELRDQEITEAGSGSDDWMQSILNNLRLELRPGRDIPLQPEHPGDVLVETEGAILALIRSVTDAVPGATTGRCRLLGDVSEPGAAITVDAQVAVFFGESITAVAEDVRTEIASVLERQTELNIAAINVTVVDVLTQPEPPAQEGNQ